MTFHWKIFHLLPVAACSCPVGLAGTPVCDQDAEQEPAADAVLWGFMDAGVLGEGVKFVKLSLKLVYSIQLKLMQLLVGESG